MTLTQLRYIVALSRERHFGGAAGKSFVGAPTLSIAEKKLDCISETALALDSTDQCNTPGRQSFATATIRWYYEIATDSARLTACWTGLTVVDGKNGGSISYSP